MQPSDRWQQADTSMMLCEHHLWSSGLKACMSLGLVPQEWRRLFGSTAARAGHAQQGALPHFHARSRSAAAAHHSHSTCADTLRCERRCHILCCINHSIKRTKSSWFQSLTPVSHSVSTVRQQILSIPCKTLALNASELDSWRVVTPSAWFHALLCKVWGWLLCFTQVPATDT